jgi:glutathione S-transferase
VTRLITIYFSHYCEKARWALERARVPFVEEPHVPGISGMAAMIARGNKSVPVLVTDDAVLKESADIVRWADPTLHPDDDEDVASLCSTFDRSLGPATRRVAYDRVLRLPSERLGEVFSFGLSPWEADLGRTLAFALAAMIKKGLRVTPEGVTRSRVAIDEVFATVAQRLKDGRRYLCGDAFTAADLTFAALAAPVVVPHAYARFFPATVMGSIRDDIVRPYEDTVAFAHAERMYELHRP